MQRRSNSKSVAKQPYQETVLRSASKRRKNSQANDRQNKFNQIQKRIKENLMFSLIEIFQQSRNDPSLIVPWMNEFEQLEQRIIGASYMIVGPSQSGKYSAVKFALGEHHKDVQEILINCEVSTTEHQFVQKILTEFSLKAPKCKWPTEERDINKIITNDNIDFEKLNPYIEKGNLKFLIIIRNAEHLVGFKKQTMLYNLFEWMRSSFIQERGGLVILTRNLMLIDRFQKRVRSRFQGNRLTIFRPTQADIYIKIITKRIEAVIKDKEIWIEEQKIQGIAMDIEKQVYDSDEQTNTRKRPQPTRAQKSKKIDIEQFQKQAQNYKYAKQIIDYSSVLNQYLNEGFEQLGIRDFFEDKINEFYQSKNKEQMRLYSQQSILSVDEQIACLNKIKKAIEKSKKISHYFKTKILQNQIITIPFVLRIFQHIFLTLEQSIVKELSVENLQLLILKLLQKNVEFQFPVIVMQSNSIESLNNIQLLLLIIIYKMIKSHIYPIRLTKIHNDHKSLIHKTIHLSAQYESDRIPMKLIEQSIDRLYRSGIIDYQPFNVWNCEISLLIQLKKIEKGLEHLLSNCRSQLRHNILQELKDIFYEQK